MIVTKIAIALGVVVLGFACWMAVVGIGAAAEGLLTVFALFVLVAGGNLLAGRSSVNRRAPVGPAGSPEPDGQGRDAPEPDAPDGAARTGEP